MYHIQNNFLKAAFRSKGAELTSLSFENNELIWCAKEPWERHAPILFPIVGKLKNNTYIYRNKNYSLPQHGFARDLEWLCTYHNHTSIEFELVDNEYTFQMYPFHFSLIVKYELIDSSLNILFRVFNPHHQNLLFSIGYHPAFDLPFELNNYSLKFYPLQHKITTSVLSNGLISPQKKIVDLQNNQLNLSTSLFEKDAIIIENTDITNIELTTPHQPFYLNIFTGNAQNIGLWTKPHCKDFICIEPWMGIADNEGCSQILEEKKDIIHLAAYQSWTWNLKIEIFNKK